MSKAEYVSQIEKMLNFRSFWKKKFREIVKLALVEIINNNEKWNNSFSTTVVLKVWINSISITRKLSDMEIWGIHSRPSVLEIRARQSIF